MTATLTRVRPGLATLTRGVRRAVAMHADWYDTAQLVADVLRRHLPDPDILSVAERQGDPDGYNSHTIQIYGTDITRVGSSVRRYHS